MAILSGQYSRVTQEYIASSSGLVQRNTALSKTPLIGSRFSNSHVMCNTSLYHSLVWSYNIFCGSPMYMYRTYIFSGLPLKTPKRASPSHYTMHIPSKKVTSRFRMAAGFPLKSLPDIISKIRIRTFLKIPI